MASICNEERASSGVMSGHDRKTLSLSGEQQPAYRSGSAADQPVFVRCRQPLDRRFQPGRTRRTSQRDIEMAKARFREMMKDRQ